MFRRNCFKTNEVYNGGYDLDYNDIVENIDWEPSYNIKDDIEGGNRLNMGDDFDDYCFCVMSDN